MAYAVIIIVALLASGLTMFSGFGLGTLLLPAFALFLPVQVAVAATAVVHAANNVFKVVLLGKYADGQIVLRFGLPAIGAAMAGAALLGWMTELPTWGQYQWFGHTASLTPLKGVLGLIILGFAVLELHPRFQTLRVDRKYLPLGGVLSGFFGGLSGHQGALRSAFLAKVDLRPQAFVGTNAVIGLLVDAVRLFIYGMWAMHGDFLARSSGHVRGLIVAGILAAFAGVLLGTRLLHKITMRAVQIVTGTLLIVVSMLLMLGIV